MYFDDCFDLLSNKVKVPIAGFGAGVKSKQTAEFSIMNNIERDKSGKWIPPYLDGKVNVQKVEYNPKGQTE